MATIKNKEECIKILKKFAPTVSKGRSVLPIEDHDFIALDEEESVGGGEQSSLIKTGGVSSVSQNSESTRGGTKEDQQKKGGKSNSESKLRKKRKDELANGEKTIDTEDKENIHASRTREDTHPTKTRKEKCSLTDLQYEELFKSVLQKSAQDYLEVSEKILEPPLEGEQNTCSETNTLPQTAGDSILTMDPSDSSSAKKSSNKSTKKPIETVGPKSHKLSLTKKKKTMGAGDNQGGRKRTRKGQPKKIVKGYTQITDQEDSEEETRPINQCIAWVQCSKVNCEKWRKLENGVDPSSLPDSWSCSQNTDFNYNNCDIPEESWSGSDDEVIYATFVPGSVVWAKQFGFPWWPGMVESDPDIGVYFLFTTHRDQLPSKYHVTFFGDSASRAWISASMLKNFHELTAESLGLKRGKTKDYIKMFDASLQMAEEAEKMNLQDRIAKFGFSGRYRHDSKETPQPGYNEADYNVSEKEESPLAPKKLRKGFPKSHVVKGSEIINASDVEHCKEKEVSIQQTKPVSANEKSPRALRKFRKTEPRLHAPKELECNLPKDVENDNPKEGSTVQSKPVCENGKSNCMLKIRNGGLKSHLGIEELFALAPKKSKIVKESEDNPTQSKLSKTKFCVPKKTTYPKQCAAVTSDTIKTEWANNKVEPSIDPEKVAKCLKTTNVENTNDKLVKKVATSIEEEDSVDNLLEKVDTNGKELEEAFGDDMLDILTVKQTELQDDDFSLFLNEDSQEP